MKSQLGSGTKLFLLLALLWVGQARRFAGLLDEIKDNKTVKDPEEVITSGNVFRYGTRSNRYTMLTCNHDLKRSYINIHFDYLLKEPLEATYKTKSVCPNMSYSCCSETELETVKWIAKAYTQEIKNYFLLSSKLFIRMTKLNIDQFWFDFKYLLRTERGECVKNNLPPDYETIIKSMKANSDIYLNKNYELYSRIKKYYTGFLCTLCDPVEHLKMIVVKVPRKKKMYQTMRIDIDVSTCQGLFELKQLHYEISLYILKLQKLISPMLCLFTDEKLDQSLFDRMEKDVLQEKEENESCLYARTGKLDILRDRDCVKRCQKKFHFQAYINSNNFISLAAIMRNIFFYFDSARLVFSESKAKIIHTMIQEANNEQFYRRIYEMWPPVMVSPYTRQHFQRVVSYNGINFFDNRIAEEGSEEARKQKFFTEAQDFTEMITAGGPSDNS